MINKQSTQSLFLDMRSNGASLATGTGFLMNAKSGPALVTARHNLTGLHHQTKRPLSKSGATPDEVIIYHNVAGKLGTWVKRTEFLYAKGKGALWVEHPKHGDAIDAAALPLTELEDVELLPYERSDEHPIVYGPADPVSVIGFPFGLTAGGLFAVWATGFGASEPTVDQFGLPAFLIDCRTREGQSGSPVVAFRSGGVVSLEGGNSAAFAGPVYRLLGLYTGRVRKDSDIGFAWKIEAIEEILAVA